MQRLLDVPVTKAPLDHAIPFGSGDTDGATSNQCRIEKRISEFRTLWNRRSEPQDLGRIETKIDALIELVGELKGSLPETGSSKDGRWNYASTNAAVAETESSLASESSDGPKEHDGGLDIGPGPLEIVVIPSNEASEPELHRAGLPLKEFTSGDSKLELLVALEERDHHINYLTSQIREIPIRIHAWLRLLQEDPDAVPAVMKDAEDTVSRLLQLSELEWSVERAKLARERSNLAIEKRQLEEVRPNQDLGQRASERASERSNETPLQRRWDKFFPPQEKRS